MDEAEDEVVDESRRVGAEIRRLRELRGMTAKQVAELAEVSAAYLSRLENGKVSPTVATLSRIVQAMGTRIGALFGEGTDQGPVVRRDERQLVRSRGVNDYRVTPGWASRLEVLESLVEPGRGSSSGLHTHPGDEECVLVLDGELRLWLGSEEHLLGEGDSATFSCQSPHKWHNATDQVCRVLWIFTPASY